MHHFSGFFESLTILEDEDISGPARTYPPHASIGNGKLLHERKHFAVALGPGNVEMNRTHSLAPAVPQAQEEILKHHERCRGAFDPVCSL
ncbi:hypothetical protein Esti_004975 [Eimeria stiedai]